MNCHLSTPCEDLGPVSWNGLLAFLDTEDTAALPRFSVFRLCADQPPLALVIVTLPS